MHLCSCCHQAFRRIVATTEEHVLDEFQEMGRNVSVGSFCCGVHDAHVHARRGGVEKEGSVHGFAQEIVTAEGKRKITHAAADVYPRKILANPFRCFDEVQRIAVMFLHARCHGEDVRVKDDVARREAGALCQEFVGTLANLCLASEGGRLSLFVKSHDHHGGTGATNERGAFQKRRFALLQGNGIDHGFPLHAFQRGFNDFKA